MAATDEGNPAMSSVGETYLPSPAARFTGYQPYSYVRDASAHRDAEFVEDRVAGSTLDLGLTEAQRERAARLLRDNIVISLHDHPQRYPKDVATTPAHIRAGRPVLGYGALASSGLSAVFDNMWGGTASIFSPAGWKWDDILTDMGMRLADMAHQDYLVPGRTVEDIVRAHESGRLAVVLALESATPIENELDRLDVLYGLGIRQIGIAYSESNMLGSGLKESRDGGLTAFGRRAVTRMNELGLSIDVSHASDLTCLDTIEMSSQPVMITHAGARALWPTRRMKPDEVLIACAESGGVLGISAAPHTTISAAHPRHTIDSVMDHFEYCAGLMGIDHVTFGPDTIYGDHVASHEIFAANLGVHVAEKPPDHPRVKFVGGLENPTECFPNIVGWLVQHGYSDEEIVAVVGGNVLRVLGEVWS